MNCSSAGGTGVWGASGSHMTPPPGQEGQQVLVPKPDTRPNHLGRFSEIRDPCTLPKIYRFSGTRPRTLGLGGSFGFAGGLGGPPGCGAGTSPDQPLPACQPVPPGRERHSRSAPGRPWQVLTSRQQTLRRGLVRQTAETVVNGPVPVALSREVTGPSKPPAGHRGRPLSVRSSAALEPEGHPTPGPHSCPGPRLHSRGTGLPMGWGRPC